MKNYKIINIYIFLILVITLSGCSALDGIFSDTGEPRLKGKRIAILNNQEKMQPDSDVFGEAISLPDAWVNKFWPQAGGYPDHSMGQLELGSNLKEIWHSNIGSGGSRRHPLLVQPIVANNTVYTLDSRSKLSAFDIKTGKKKWAVETIYNDNKDSGAIGGGIAYASNKIYVTNGFKYLLSLNSKDGSLSWKVSLNAPARSAPTVANDKIYLITINNQLLVFSTKDGSLIWSYTGIENTTNLLGSVSPAVNSSIVVLPLSSGELIGLRPENGRVVWGDSISKTQATGTLLSIADIRGQPVIDKGVVYASSYSGRMVALDEITGKRLWQKEIGSGEMPWSADETVFIINTEQRLIALTRKAGEIRWVTNLTYRKKKKKDQPIWTGPVLAGARLILASNKGHILEIDPQTGKNVRLIKTKEEIMIAPIVAENTLLILTEKGKLIAYR